MDKVGSGEVINFDVKARMEEKERRSERIGVGFALSVGTKPNVVKFEVEGEAILEGKDEEIKKMLEVDPETEIPFVFQRVYQHIFMSIYLLATLIEAPYPPSNLLISNQQQISMMQMSASAAIPEEETMQTRVAAVSEKETTSQPASTSTVPQEETAVQPTPSMTPQEQPTKPEKEQTVGATAEVQRSDETQRDTEEQAPQT